MGNILSTITDAFFIVLLPLIFASFIVKPRADILAFFLIVALSPFAIKASSGDRTLQLPYIVKSGCEGESCKSPVGVRAVANKPIRVYQNPRGQKSVLTIPADTPFKILSRDLYVLETRKYRIVQKQISPYSCFHELGAKQGDILQELYYSGEGYNMMWFAGKTADCSFHGNPPDSEITQMKLLSGKVRIQYWYHVEYMEKAYCFPLPTEDDVQLVEIP